MPLVLRELQVQYEVVLAPTPQAASPPSVVGTLVTSRTLPSEYVHAHPNNIERYRPTFLSSRPNAST